VAAGTAVTTPPPPPSAPENKTNWGGIQHRRVLGVVVEMAARSVKVKAS